MRKTHRTVQPLKMKKLLIILIVLIYLLPSTGECLSHLEVFTILSKHSSEINSFPFHVYIEPENYTGFKGIALPITAYEYFQPFYSDLSFKQPNEIFATYKFSQGTRWECFLLRVPNMYTSNGISLWIFDKENNIWQKPFKIAESWGDAGYSIEVEAWIEDINNDGWLDVVLRTIEISTAADWVPPDFEETTKTLDRILIWEKNHLEDLSIKYLPKIDLNKYQFFEDIR
jgi:hypothetical protein